MKLTNLGLADTLYNKNEQYQTLSNNSKLKIIAQDKACATLGTLTVHLERKRNQEIELNRKIDQAVANGGEDLRTYYEGMSMSTREIAKITGIDIDDKDIALITGKAYDIVRMPKRTISDNQILSAQNDVIVTAQKTKGANAVSRTDIINARSEQAKQHING